MLLLRVNTANLIHIKLYCLIQKCFEKLQFCKDIKEHNLKLNNNASINNFIFTFTTKLDKKCRSHTVNGIYKQIYRTNILTQK